MASCPVCGTPLASVACPRCPPAFPLRDEVWAAWAGTQPFVSDLGSTPRPPAVQRFAAWAFNPRTGRHEVAQVGPELEPLLAAHGIPPDRVVAIGRGGS